MEVHGERDSVSVRSYTLLRIPVHRSIFPYTLIPKALCVCRVHYVSQCLDGIVIIISMPLPFDAIISLPPRTKKNIQTHTNKHNVRLHCVQKTYVTSLEVNARAETEMPVSAILCEMCAIVCTRSLALMPTLALTHNVCCVLCQTETE